jgi:hypothetical protein
MRLSVALVVAALVATIGSGTNAFGQTFTDDPLTPGTPVKAVHITELRAAIASQRAHFALPVFTFTDTTLTPTVTLVRAIHITELRSALNDVFDAAALTRPTYTDPTLAGVLINAAHIQELRAGIATIASTIAPCGAGGGALINGGTHCGTISSAGEIDTWTFNANTGDRIAVHIGEITDQNDFRPWLRIRAPNGTTILADVSGVAATATAIVAAATGTYSVLIGSFDPGLDGTGTYRLSMAATPGPITISADDQGGPLTNGATHTGQILRGDLDVWTFTANTGDRIGIHIGETAETDDFRPWIRLWAPNGASLADVSGVDATAIEAVASVSGQYLVLVASFDPAFDGQGLYRMTMTHTPGPIFTTSGDDGGPLTNGAMHTGEILRGDLDVWTFTANTGDRIALHVGQISETADFRPWIRLWAPNGASLGNVSGVDATAIEAIASVTGQYLVLVASFDPAFDGSGTYRLTMTHTPGPIVVTTGDQGGPLINGSTHTGQIEQGDLDIWTFTANTGDRIALHIGQTAETDDFRPWIRLWAPNGASLGDVSGVDATAIEAIASVSGQYLVLVASFDPGFDGEGSYRLTMTHTPGPITITAGDDGGPLTNGALHTGEITQGDLDVWTFTATAGDRIGIHIGQTGETDDFRPWIRLWGPNGASLGDQSGVDATAIEAVASVSGQYLVLVSSFDSGFNGTGTYRLTMTHTPGPVTTTGGDQGGALTSGVAQAGEILPGDLDVWTISATTGNHISVHITQTSEVDDFRPWIRLWAPSGASLANISGLDVADITSATAPASGTYLILVGSFDSGFNGNGTYQLTVTISP